LQRSPHAEPEAHAYAGAALASIGLVFGAVLLASGFNPPWGLFHDELYYWANGLRPGFGYVDHPPLAPWILRGVTLVLGDGRLAFGLVPATCAVGTVMGTGWLAWRFGAGPFGQAVAGLAVAIAPIFQIFFSFYSVNAIGLLSWTAATCLLVEIVRTGDERLWPSFGVISGLALLNKHTFLLFAAALAIGFVATPLRSHLRSRRLWVGVALAFFISSPNLVWNFVYDWPSLTFYLGRGAGVLDATIGDALEIQIIGLNPLNVLVWLPGLAFLLFAKAARPYRAFGIAFLLLFALILLSGQRRGDRIAGAYPIVFAAGGWAWDRWRPRFRNSVRITLIVLLIAAGVALMPGVLPILSPAGVSAYWEAIDEKPEVEVGDVGNNIPLFLLGRLEWERFATEVIEAWRALPRDDRERSVILTPHWAMASIIEYYGRDEALPPVVSPHNAYAFWADEAGDRSVAVVVGTPGEALDRYFGAKRRIHLFECRECASFRPDLPVHVAHEPVRPIRQLIEEWRTYDIMGVPELSSTSWFGADQDAR
jgi:hypothetical protein